MGIYVHMYVLTPDGVRLRIFGAAAARLNCARVCVRAKTKRASKWTPGAFRRPIGADRCGSTLSRADYYQCVIVRLGLAFPLRRPMSGPPQLSAALGTHNGYETARERTITYTTKRRRRRPTSGEGRAGEKQATGAEECAAEDDPVAAERARTSRRGRAAHI